MRKIFLLTLITAPLVLNGCSVDSMERGYRFPFEANDGIDSSSDMDEDIGDEDVGDEDADVTAPSSDLTGDLNLVLINRDNSLEQNFIPSDLTELAIPFVGSSSSKYMTKEAADALLLMFEEAKKDGINLRGKSGYRSYYTQETIYRTKVQNIGQKEADRFSARPGNSEHQTGLAIDIVSSEFDKLHTDFQYTNTYKWLKKNAPRFGFILRYPKGASSITGYNFEPWHYRFVGVEHAEKITNENIVLEQYLGADN